MLSCPHHQPRDWLLFNFFLLSLKHCVPQREDRVEQALPCHSPTHTWARSPAQHSPTTPEHGKARQIPTASIFEFTCFCHTTLPMAASRKLTDSPFHPSDAQGARAKPWQLSCFTWHHTPIPAGIPNDARNYNRATTP